MLGLYPIGSRAISDGPFSLVRVPAVLAATVGLGFAVSGTAGLRVPARVSIGISFALSPTLTVRQAIAASLSITFGGNPTLSVAGKPIRLSAIPQSYNLRAARETLTMKALPQSYYVRGAK
jgi:hypothetical protein